MSHRNQGFNSLIIDDLESRLKIEETDKKNDISRRHLNTICGKHLGKTAIESMKLHQSRSALKKYKYLKNLTHLCYENQFYDPSHFIKTFKSLIGINPKTFFNNVDITNENA